MHLRISALVAPVITIAILATLAGAQTVTYKVIPITSPYDQPGLIRGNDLNKAGTIALTDDQNGQQAFEWKANKPVPLTLLGGTCSTAVGINTAGHIVGGACPTGQNSMHAYLYRKVPAVDLGTFGGIAAESTQVNQTDQVSGDYTLSNGTSRGFFWQKNQWIDLGSLGGNNTYSYGMNSSGTIVGQSDISKQPDKVYGIPRFHGFIWSAGKMTDLGSIFKSHFNYVLAINDAGVAAGSADLKGDMAAHAILWNNGVVQDLSPDGNISARAVSINNLGQAVGTWGLVDTDPADGPPAETSLCPCFAVLWQNGQEIVLNSAVPPEWNLWLAAAINNKGEILALGQFNGGALETVLLKPKASKDDVDTPSHTRPIAVRPAYTGPRALRQSGKDGLLEIW